MSRYTAAQIRAKGNPNDVPYDVLVRAVKADRGNRCETDGCSAAHMIGATRKAGKEWEADSYQTLRLACNKHNPDHVPGDRVVYYQRSDYAPSKGS